MSVLRTRFKGGRAASLFSVPFFTCLFWLGNGSCIYKKIKSFITTWRLASHIIFNLVQSLLENRLAFLIKNKTIFNQNHFSEERTTQLYKIMKESIQFRNLSDGCSSFSLSVLFLYGDLELVVSHTIFPSNRKVVKAKYVILYL